MLNNTSSLLVADLKASTIFGSDVKASGCPTVCLQRSA